MRVVPADNLLVRVLFVLDLIYMFPGVLGEGNVRATLGGIDSGDAGFYGHALMLCIANQHAADFSFH